MNFKGFNLILLFFLSNLIMAQETKISLKTHSNQEVIRQMTLQEKVHLLTGLGDENWTNPKTGAETVLIDGNAGRTWDIPRLGIPATVLADGPAGLRIEPKPKGKNFTRFATAFPVATALASTWNTEILKKVGTATGNEVLEYGVDVLLSPAVNIHRNPLCGRNFEYYSEDPLLAGKMGAAFVVGVQSNGVGTSVKHFAANNMETNRNSLNSVVSQRALREIYLRTFEIIVNEANPWTIMTSYNRLNGFYTSENIDLLKTILRNEWGFKGLVMTDWWGGADAVAQLRAGNNLFMPGSYQREALTQAVLTHQINEKVLDDNIDEILTYIRKTPRFRGYIPSEKPDLSSHLKVAKEAANESIILLKNDKNTLPLSKVKSIGLFGKTSYHYIVGGTGSGEVNYDSTLSYDEALIQNKFQIHTDIAAFYKNFILNVIENAPKDANLKFVVDYASEAKLPTEKIKKAANETDVALLTIGRNAGEGFDRKETDFILSEEERNLIQEVSKAYHALGKKVIVMLNIGGVINTSEWQNEVDAILLNWQTGQMGAVAAVDILNGKINPSGKLPMTFPVKYEEVPSAEYFPGEPKDNPVDSYYNEGIFVGYRYYDSFKKPVSFPFGFGLSYTQFQFSDLKVTQTLQNKSITIEFFITNTGKMSGKEVVQLYVSKPQTGLVKPEKELIAFVKTELLSPNQKQTFTIEIPVKNLSSFDPSLSAWVLAKGTYQLKLGNSSQNILTHSDIIFDNQMIIEKVNDVLYPNKKLKEIHSN